MKKDAVEVSVISDAVHKVSVPLPSVVLGNGAPAQQNSRPVAARRLERRHAALLATTMVLTLAAPPAMAEKLCRIGPSQSLEQALSECRRDDVVLAIFPKPTAPAPSVPRPGLTSRIASLVARICDLEQEVFLQPGSTEEEFVLTCVYAGRILPLP